MCSYSWRVPFHVSGRLTILASGDLQGRGLNEGVLVHYHWHLWNNLPILYVWVPLVCLLLLPENRNRQAWFILLPLAVLSAGLHLFLWATPMDAAGEDVFFQIGLAHGIGLASVGLLSGRLLNQAGAVRITGMVLVLGVVIGLASMDSVQPMGHIMTTTFLGIITLFTLLFVRSLCKRGFRIRQFYYRFLGGTFIFGAVFALMWTVLMSMAKGSFPPGLLLLAIMLVISGIHLALTTPFLMLMFYNTFWRTRFFGMLSLSHALKS